MDKKKYFRSFCKIIGCSGVSEKCKTSPEECEILKKFVANFLTDEEKIILSPVAVSNEMKEKI
jgi:hypothetical protein